MDRRYASFSYVFGSFFSGAGADHVHVVFYILISVEHFPEWLPGMGFKKMAREWRKTTENLTDVPHRFVEKQMVRVCTHECHVFTFF